MAQQLQPECGMRSAFSVLCVLCVLPAFPALGQDADAAAPRSRQEAFANHLAPVIGTPAAETLVDRALSDPDAAVRLEALQAIHKFVEPGSFSVSWEVCQDESAVHRSSGLDRLVDRAVGRLTDANGAVRAQAIHILRAHDLTPQRIRAACRTDGGRRPPDYSNMVLSPMATARLEALANDADAEVQRALAFALLVFGPLNDRYVDRLLGALSSTDVDINSATSAGLQRLPAAPLVASTLVDRMAGSSTAIRRHVCDSLVLWEADPQILERLALWADRELDPPTQRCLATLTERQRARLAFLTANAGALDRVAELQRFATSEHDPAAAVPRVRAALRDDDPLVRLASLHIVVDWTTWDGLRFATSHQDWGDGPMPTELISAEDFAEQVDALLDDREPEIQAIALELVARRDLFREVQARPPQVQEDGEITAPLSAQIVTRLTSVPPTADPFVRQVALRLLLAYAPVDAAHVTRVLEALSHQDGEVASDAPLGIARLRSDDALIASLIVGVQQLNARARRDAATAVVRLSLGERALVALRSWTEQERDALVMQELHEWRDAPRD